MQCPGGRGLPRTFSTFVTILWDPKTQEPQLPEPGNQGGIPSTAAEKPRAPDIKTRTLDMFKSFPLGDTSPRKCGRGRVRRWHLLSGAQQRGKHKDVSHQKKNSLELKKKKMASTGWSKPEGQDKHGIASLHPQRAPPCAPGYVPNWMPVPQADTPRPANEPLSHKIVAPLN